MFVSLDDVHVIYAALYTPIWLPIVDPAQYPGPVVYRVVKIFISAFFADSFVRNNIFI